MDECCTKRIKCLQNKFSEVNELWKLLSCQFNPLVHILEKSICLLENECDKVKFLSRYPTLNNYVDKIFNFLIKSQCELEILEREILSDTVCSRLLPVVDGESNNNNESNNNDVESEVLIENPLSCSSESYKSSMTSKRGTDSLCEIKESNSNKRMHMIYSHGNSPSNFWLKYSSSIESTYVENIIKTITEKTVKSLQSIPKVGAYVLAFSNNKFVRGQVLRVREGTDFCDTFLMLLDIDSGRMNKFSLDSLVQSSENLWRLKPQAINCQLKDVPSNSDLDRFTEYFMSSILDSNLLVEVLEKSTDFFIPRYIVDIYIHNEETGVFHSLNEVINSKLKNKQISSMNNEQVATDIQKKVEPNDYSGKENCSNVLSDKTSSLLKISNVEKVIDSTSIKVLTDDESVHNVNCGLVSNCTNSYLASGVTQNSKYLSNKGFDECSIKSQDHLEHNFLSENNHISTVTVMGMEKSNNTLNSGQYKCLENTNLHYSEPYTKVPFVYSKQNIEGDVLTNSTLNPNAPDYSSKLIRSGLTQSPQKFKNACPRSVKLKTGQCYAGKPFNGVISHILSPGEFYVHIVNEENIFIDELGNKMMEFYTSNKFNFTSKDSARLNIDSFCACLYPDDNQWYRVEIIDWIESSLNNVLVLYVDYGNKLAVDFRMLQPLIPEFAGWPIFAQKCHLKLICPLACDCNHKDHNWPSATTQTFSSLLLKDQEFSFTGFELNSVGSLAVDIADPSCHGNTINEILVKLKHAKEEWDPMKDDYETKIHGLYDDEDACVAVSGYAPQDEKYVCKFFAKNGKCPKGLTCRKKHVIPYKDGWTSDQESTYQDAFNQLALPVEGEYVNVEVTSIVRIDLFYVVILTESSGNEEETLEILNDFINEHSNIKKMKKLLVTPAEGQIVLAQYPQDERWYRARVINTNNDENEVKVFFVDYGHSIWISELKIRAIEPKFLHLPFQAVECGFANAEMNPKLDFDLETKAIEHFKNIVDDQGILKAKVTGNSSQRLDVILFDSAGVDIGSAMIEDGFCLPKKIRLNPTFNRQIPG